MRKIFYTILSVSVIFIVYMLVRNNIEVKAPNTVLETNNIQTLENWEYGEEDKYTALDMPTVKNRFVELGYPPFIFTEENGKEAERSSHANGSQITLFSEEDNYYLKNGYIDVFFDKDNFISSELQQKIYIFKDFIQTITNSEMKTEDIKLLSRSFSQIMNNDGDTLTLKINGLRMLLSADKVRYILTIKF